MMGSGSIDQFLGALDDDDEVFGQVFTLLRDEARWFHIKRGAVAEFDELAASDATEAVWSTLEEALGELEPDAKRWRRSFPHRRPERSKIKRKVAS